MIICFFRKVRSLDVNIKTVTSNKKLRDWIIYVLYDVGLGSIEYTILLLQWSSVLEVEDYKFHWWRKLNSIYIFGSINWLGHQSFAAQIVAPEMFLPLQQPNGQLKY